MDELAATIAGRAITVAAPAPNDIAPLIALVNALAAEPGYLFIMPIDPETGQAALAAHLAATAADGSETVLLAHCGSALAGLATGRRGVHPARHGILEIGLGVAAPWRRHGVGRALMAGLERRARGAGYHRLELRVVTRNEAAIALYRSLGFEPEGTQRATAIVQGERLDELMMAKLLD